MLGISAFYHDSAAALIVDGQIVAAAQEESVGVVAQEVTEYKAVMTISLR